LLHRGVYGYNRFRLKLSFVVVPAAVGVAQEVTVTDGSLAASITLQLQLQLQEVSQFGGTAPTTRYR
jgi:hypothetical protein